MANKLWMALVVVVLAWTASACSHGSAALPDLPVKVMTAEQATQADKPVHADVIVDNARVKIARVVIQPKNTMPAHATPVPVSVYTISGQGEMEVNGSGHALAEGTIMTLPAGAQHAVLNKGEAPLVLLVHYLRSGQVAQEHHHH